MSAICGLISRVSDSCRSAETLRKMAQALPLHPDTGTIYTCQLENGGFGVHQQFPLASLDADKARSLYQQPDLSIVCAAEFYNAPALRLAETLPPEAGGATLLAAAYRHFGPECVRHLQGIFTFALWDNKEQQLLLATDPFGIRPVYYCQNGDVLLFGSRIKALLQGPLVPRQINLEAIYQYLYFSCIPTPNSIYRDIKRLPSGHYLQFSKAGIRLHRYWGMRYEEDHRRPTEYFASGIRRYLSEAIRVQASFDNGVQAPGTFLSGGTDSSTITGLLSQRLNRPIKSFSIGFQEDYFNEIEYARLAARRFQTEHHEYFVTPKDTAALIPRLVDAYDEPFGNASAVPTYYCAKLAREQGVDALLAGDGGDELFGGNTRYVTDKVFEVYHSVPQWLRHRCFEPILFGLPFPDRGMFSKARKYVRRSNIPQPQRYFSYNLLHMVDLPHLFTDDFLASLPGNPALSLAKHYYETAHANTMLNRLLNIDLKIILTDNDLRKVTRMCDLANVQVRYPMLDQTLVEFSGTIPTNLKVKGFNKRYIFKEAFKNLLPPEILEKKKHGFGLPISPWLRESPCLRELARDTLLSQASLQRGYFQRTFLQNLFEFHRSDSTNFFGDNLWVFLMLELWHQSHDRA